MLTRSASRQASAPAPQLTVQNQRLVRRRSRVQRLKELHPVPVGVGHDEETHLEGGVGRRSESQGNAGSPKMRHQCIQVRDLESQLVEALKAQMSALTTYPPRLFTSYPPRGAGAA